MHPATEDWTGRKQLPLRQTRDKPILKYSVSTSPSIPGKPVQLFSQADLAFHCKNSYGNLSNGTSAGSGHVSPAAFFHHQSPSPSGAGYNTGSTSHSHTPTGTKTKSRKQNPYARPMSAKDLEPPDGPVVHTIKKNLSTTSLVSSVSTGSNSSLSSVGRGSVSGVPTASASVTMPEDFQQTNTFMRPRSAFRTDATKMSTQGFINDIASAVKITSTGFQTTTANITNMSPPVSDSEHAMDTSPFRESSKPHSVRFADDNNVSKSNSGTMEHSQTAAVNTQNSNNKSTGNATSSPSKSSLVKTSQGKPPVAQTQSRPTSAKVNVRNPNYTPTKPYSEVNQVSSDSSAHSSPAHRPLPTPPPGSPLDKLAINGDIHMHTMSVLPMPPSDAKVKKMPVTNTVTGTVYYKKSSKAEELLHDFAKRPKADGAPSVPRPPVDRPRPPPAEQNHAPQKTSRPLPTGKSLSAGANRSLRVTDARPARSQVKQVTRKVEVVDEEDDDDEWEDEADAEPVQKPPASERQPGDGEDFSMEYDDDDDDDVMDGIEDDDGGDSDGSDSYSISSGATSRKNSSRVRSATKRLSDLSIKSSRSGSRPSTGRSRPMSAVTSSDGDAQPPVTASLFPNVPPTINFVGEGEKVEQLPWELRKMLKWKMSTITPNVVKNCIARIGFRATKKNHDWIGYWGKHMKAQGFKAIREYQKVNHFPGSFQIGRKDRLWRNLSRLQVQFGKREFSFFPQTYVLPFDTKLLKRAWEDGGSKQKWIIKPPASARGIGIKVIHKWNQIPRKRPVIVQRYLSRPYLINDSKFDLRIYVYVSSYDPLRVYVYDDGLVRFASQKYSNSLKSLNNKYMHLTNYSINKRNNEYESNTDESVCQGHKWGLKALWGYLRKKGVNVNNVWDSIKDLVIKTILSSESCVNSLVKANVRRRYTCHELFGFDVMLDENLKPWIIEVNISPSLHSNSPLDINIKGGMIKDLFNIAGFMIPDKNEVTPGNAPSSEVFVAKYAPSSELSLDRRLWPNQIAPDERAKHAYFCQRHNDEATQLMMLDMLTPDDIRILVESIDEDSRKGSFERVFPTPHTHKYLRFMEAPRYYNLLLDSWVQKYYRMEHRGIMVLENYCAKGVHLDNPTNDPKHQWSPPSTLSSHDPRALSAPLSSNKTLSTSALPKLRKKSTNKVKSKLPQAGSTSSINSAGNTPRPTPPKSTLVTPAS